MTESEDNEIGNVVALLGETKYDTLVAFGEDAHQLLDLGDLEAGELRFHGECPYTKITVESQSWCNALRMAIAEFEGRTRQVASIEQVDVLLHNEAPNRPGEWRCRCPSNKEFDTSRNPKFVARCDRCGAERPSEGEKP